MSSWVASAGHYRHFANSTSSWVELSWVVSLIAIDILTESRRSELNCDRVDNSTSSWVELHRHRYRHFADATQLYCMSSWVELCRYKRGLSCHFLLQAPQCPCSVRKRFSRDHCCWGMSKLGCRIVGSDTRWELTTWAYFQLCLHWLLISTGCKFSHSGFLDVKSRHCYSVTEALCKHGFWPTVRSRPMP